jgi:hypothetical protein
MFEKGLENVIGSADPTILKAILQENVLISTAAKKFKTPNYGLVTSDLLEYVRLLGNIDEYERNEHTKLSDDVIRENKNIPIFLLEVARGMHGKVRGPTEAELKDLEPVFQQIRELYNRVADGGFPGDIGDVQHSVDFVCSNAEIAQEIISITNAFVRPLQLRPGKEPGPDHDCFIFLDTTKAPTVGPFAITVCYRDIDSVAFEALKSKIMSSFGSSVSIEDRKKVVYCEHGNEEALVDHLKTLNIQNLRAKAGLSAADEEGCIKQILTSYRTETDEWKQSGTIRKQGRISKTLRELMAIDVVIEAGMRVEEAIQAYVYTGPSYLVSCSQCKFCKPSSVFMFTRSIVSNQL